MTPGPSRLLCALITSSSTLAFAACGTDPAADTDTSEVDTSEVDTSEVDTSEVDTSEVDTSEVDTSEADVPEGRCEAVAAGTRQSLVDHDLWRIAEPDEDPWREFRPADIECDPTARQAEDFGGTYSFGIDTALCSYTTIVQEAMSDVCPGEGVLVWLWRFALTGPEGASAHLSARIGDETVFSDVVPIPATSGLWADTYTVERFHPAGTPITFHIRNHGNNTYQLLDISRCQGQCRPD